MEIVDTYGTFNRAWTDIQNYFKGAKFQKTIDIDARINAIGGKVKTRGYATGGFPAVGEMFIAREAGPELVGRMGSRTAVANNNQIIDGIYRAVYAAMSGIKMGGGDLHITINNEDGTKIERVIENYNNFISRNGGQGGFII